MLRYLLICLLTGCPKDDTAKPKDTEQPPGLIELSDGHNASITMSLGAHTARLASGQDATIDWSALSLDLMRRPLDPSTDVSDARIYAFQTLTPEEILAGFAADELSQSDVSFIVSCEPQDARCDLEDFVTMGHQFIAKRDFVEGRGRLMLELLGDPELGPLALAFLEPDASSSAHVYAMQDGDSSLQLELELGGSAIPLAPGHTPTLDWSGLTQDAQGGSIDADDLDRLQLYRFEQAADTEDPYTWATRAAERWSLEADDAQVDLAALEGETAFTGIDTGSSWLLVLSCSRCNLTAPRFVGLLEPSG
jgi:hypothetical protein